MLSRSTLGAFLGAGLLSSGLCVANAELITEASGSMSAMMLDGLDAWNANVDCIKLTMELYSGPNANFIAAVFTQANAETFTAKAEADEYDTAAEFKDAPKVFALPNAVCNFSTSAGAKGLGVLHHLPIFRPFFHFHKNLSRSVLSGTFSRENRFPPKPKKRPKIAKHTKHEPLPKRDAISLKFP